MLSCVSSLSILDINPLLEILFANIVSHLVCGLFILLMVSLAVQVFYFDIILFVDFCFCFPYLRKHIQKILQRQMLKSILLMFSSRSFIDSGIAFKSLIYF